MTIMVDTATDTDCELLFAISQANDATAYALELLREALKPGREVHWKRGEHVQTGVVEAVLGFALDSARIRIRNTRTGKIVFIYWGSVVADTCK